MKITLYILIFLITSVTFAQNDTINQIDHQQFKQGYWVNYFENTEKILEEGQYLNNQREGVWKQYLEDGTLSSEITYIDDEPNGYAKIYYSNGQTAEEGLWKEDVWIGEYISYYKNGNINYKWNFSDDGTRTGKQEYFHENGKKMISGNWNQGKESGVIKRYNKQGLLTEEQTYNNGEVNPELTVKHNTNTQKKLPKDSVRITKVPEPAKELEFFNATGERKLYNKKRQLWKEGYFEEGKLIKGKVYYYNYNNELIKTEIYNKGKVYDTIKPKNK